MANGNTDKAPFSWPGWCCVLVLYMAHLMDYCNSQNSNMLDDLSENITSKRDLIAVTSETVFQSGESPDVYALDMDSHDDELNKDTDRNIKDIKNDDMDSKSNDVLHKLGLDHIDIATADDMSLQNISLSTAFVKFTTEAPNVYTRRDIYIRGHLLKHRPPGKKTFHPPERSDGLFRTPNSVHLARVQNFRDNSEPDSGNRKKRKHNSKEDKFYNYKLLYDTIKSGGDPNRKNTEFYAWIFGAAMLSLGALTTVTSCFVFCFCGDRVRKKRTARPRRPHDKAGEYERVGSVSSIVDHTGEPLDTIYEENIDNVTII